MVKLFFIFLSFVYLYSSEYYMYKSKKIPLEQVINQTQIRGIENIKFYKTNQDVVLGVDGTILIKVKESSPVESIFEDFDLEMIEKLTANLYLVKVKNIDNTLSIANSLHQSDIVEYAQPNFIKKMEKR